MAEKEGAKEEGAEEEGAAERISLVGEGEEAREEAGEEELREGDKANGEGEFIFINTYSFYATNINSKI